MSLIDRLLGNSKVIDAGVDGIDAIFHTDEEKAKEKMTFLKLYEPYKIAQRLLMLIVCIPYVTCWVGAYIATSYNFDNEPLLKMLDGDMGTGFILIVAFYFGGGAVSGIMDRFKK